MNLMQGLQEEISRNKMLWNEYKKIPGGVFGAAFILKDIEDAEKAIAEGDTIAMINVLKVLQEHN